MKILSFDVGIKNLAYCLIHKDDNNNFKIEDWDVINLTDERIKCMCLNKNKKLCSSYATYSYMLNGNKIFCCNKHKKEYIKPKIQIDGCRDDDKCQYKNRKGNLCNKRAKGILDNKSLCNTHIKSESNLLIKKTGPSKIVSQNSNKISNFKLISKLSSELESRKNLLTVNEVVIENQPSLINPIMKTISTFIYSYFYIRGIVDKKITESSIDMVRFISPSNKLKINKNHTKKLIGSDKKKAYEVTKKLSRIYCKALIKDDNDKLELLNTHNKKDDLCDAFLQGFYCLYYENNNKDDEQKYKNIFDELSKNIKTIDDINNNLN